MSESMETFVRTTLDMLDEHLPSDVVESDPLGALRTFRGLVAEVIAERDGLLYNAKVSEEARDSAPVARPVCTCDEWDPALEKINGPLITAQARNPHLTQTPEFHFLPFRFCPWCGNRARTASPDKSPE